MIRTEQRPATTDANPDTYGYTDAPGAGARPVHEGPSPAVLGGVMGTNPPVTVPAAPRDQVDVPAAAPTFVQVNDHRDSNPANWTPKQWIEAMKQNPQKYVQLFAEMKAADTLSPAAKDGKDEIMLAGKAALDAHNESMALLSNLQASSHQLMMALIGNIRG